VVAAQLVLLVAEGTQAPPVVAWAGKDVIRVISYRLQTGAVTLAGTVADQA
jgi:hypothetical protein